MRKIKYRSGLESAIHAKLSDDFEYEPFRLPYTIHRKYVPDFVHDEKKILIEAKGYFRVGDTQKYTAIRDSMPEWELVFVLSDPLKKVRKGSKLNMGQWCEKEGFKCYTVKTATELLEYVRNKNVI
jgi:hypothetical protein